MYTHTHTHIFICTHISIHTYYYDVYVKAGCRRRRAKEVLPVVEAVKAEQASPLATSGGVIFWCPLLSYRRTPVSYRGYRFVAG